MCRKLLCVCVGPILSHLGYICPFNFIILSIRWDIDSGLAIRPRTVSPRLDCAGPPAWISSPTSASRVRGIDTVSTSDISIIAWSIGQRFDKSYLSPVASLLPVRCQGGWGGGS